MMAMLLVAMLIIAVGVLLLQYLRERSHRRQRPLIGEWPIPTISPAELDPLFCPGPFGPSAETEVAFIGKGPFTVEGGTTDAEAWILAVLAKLCASSCSSSERAPARPRISGRGTRLHADARHRAGAPHRIPVRIRRRPGRDRRRATRIGVRDLFVLRHGGRAEDRAAFWRTARRRTSRPWAGTRRSAFVDGSHAYSYVVSDSAKAMELGTARRDRVVARLRWSTRHSAGVYRALNELAKQLPLARLDGTKLVAFRRPLDDRPPR